MLLHNQAIKKYNELSYPYRQRVLKFTDTEYASSIAQVHHHNAADSDGWYTEWVELVQRLALDGFREKSPAYILKFTSVKLGNWNDTVANRMEKQMKTLSAITKEVLKNLKIYRLRKCHYDAESYTLYVIQQSRDGFCKAKTVDFSGKQNAADILTAIFKNPEIHHALFDVLETFDYELAKASLNGDTRGYDEVQNINKKILKEIKLDGLLMCRGGQVWVEERWL